MDARFKTFILLLLGLGSWTFSSAFAQSTPFAPKRKLTLELEQVEGITHYEIEVRRRGKNSLSKPIFFKSKKDVWQAVLAPGDYEIRLRGYDDRQVPGEWSPPTLMQVKHSPIVITEPQEEQILENDRGGQTEVSLKWTASSTAKDFIVQVRSSGALVREEKTNREELSVKLPSGREYEVTVIAADSEPSNPRKFSLMGSKLEKVRFKAPQSKDNKIVLSWNENPKAKNFATKLITFDTKQNFLNAQEGIIDNAELLQEGLPDGTYALEVRANASLYPASETETQYFLVENNKVVAFGDSLAELDQINELQKSKRLWFGFHSVSASFRGFNQLYLSDLEFSDAPGFGLSAEYEYLNFFKHWDLKALSFYQMFGAMGTDGISARAETLIFNLDLERRFRVIRSWGLSALLGAGVGYDEHVEFIGFGNTGSLGLEYFSSLDLRLILGLKWQNSNRFSFTTALQISRPLHYFQKPGHSIEADDHAQILFRLDWRYSPLYWLSFGIDGGGYNEHYKTEKDYTAWSHLEISHATLRLGRQF